MNKPKPLDLEEEILLEMNQFIPFLESEIEDEQKRDNLLKAVEELIKEIKQRIKSACEFYLRYRDNPELLKIEQEIEPPERFREYYAKSKIKNVSIVSWNLQNYNDRLFKLAFKDVIDDEK